MEIGEAVNMIAAQMGSRSIMTSLLDDERAFTMGVSQLILVSGEARVTTLVHRCDIEGVLNDRPSDRFETRIRLALGRILPQQRRCEG